MAINVNAANNQAAQLNDNISKLRDAKRQLQLYKTSVSNNWQGKEVSYILTAIDKVIGDIDGAISNLDSLSTDIKNVAAQIKREEDAAAARARAAKQRTIIEAQNAYDTAQNELNTLLETRENLLARYNKASAGSRARIFREIQELNKSIENAESKVQITYNALRAAKS